MKKEERDSLKLEIDARELLIKKLKSAKDGLQKLSDKEKKKREDKINSMTEYANIEEAREVWGWGAISDKEFEEVKTFFEKGADFIANTVSPQEYAHKLLTEYIVRLHREVASIKFELLPEEEKRRIWEQEEKKRAGK